MNLKPLLSITLVLGSFLLGNCREAFADGGNTVQTRLEQMAQTYSHFSLSVIIRNQPLRLWPAGGWTKPATMSYREWAGTANPLAAEQVRLAGELRAVNGNRDALVALLNDANPKVRTLALGAIFQREDGRDLPLIAGLVNDSAETFPDLHDSVSSAGGVRPLAELETLQTVGRVAQVMLAFWQVPGHGLGPREAVSAKDFAKYWKKYAGRNYSASWFAVKMARATQQTTPIQRECRPDIHRVLAEMNALPMPDRALIQLYVLAPGWFESEPDDLIVSDVELIALAKKLRPNLLLQFLQGQKVSDDPD
ncbi:MAG TPA: hypothetical protein VFC44_13135, partial [Candidatus Saccharimonadales bacterium]|nr:hypothetical protein [Candidatus Saccharimonadales bacterium]